VLGALVPRGGQGSERREPQKATDPASAPPSRALVPIVHQISKQYELGQSSARTPSLRTRPRTRLDVSEIERPPLDTPAATTERPARVLAPALDRAASPGSRTGPEGQRRYGLPTNVVTDCPASEPENRASDTEMGVPASRLELEDVTYGANVPGHAVPDTKNETCWSLLPLLSATMARVAQPRFPLLGED
jgi:hypothetical protein